MTWLMWGGYLFLVTSLFWPTGFDPYQTTILGIPYQSAFTESVAPNIKNIASQYEQQYINGGLYSGITTISIYALLVFLIYKSRSSNAANTAGILLIGFLVLGFLFGSLQVRLLQGFAPGSSFLSLMGVMPFLFLGGYIALLYGFITQRNRFKKKKSSARQPSSGNFLQDNFIILVIIVIQTCLFSWILYTVRQEQYKPYVSSSILRSASSEVCEYTVNYPSDWTADIKDYNDKFTTCDMVFEQEKKGYWISIDLYGESWDEIKAARPNAQIQKFGPNDVLISTDEPIAYGGQIYLFIKIGKNALRTFYRPDEPVERAVLLSIVESLNYTGDPNKPFPKKF